MADPFVQRMMARTQARRHVLGKVTGELDKENSRSSEKSSSLNSTNTSTSPVHTKNYKTDLDKISSPEKKISNDSKEVLQESSINTLISHHLSTPVSSHKVSDTHILPSSSSTRKPRFQHLVQRTKQMEEWEDDYTYHSVCSGSPQEVETSDLSLHETTNASHSVEVKQHDLTETTRYTTNEMHCLYGGKETTPAKYYFGEFRMPTNNTGPKDSYQNLISSQASHVSHYYKPQSPVDTSFQSTRTHFSSLSPSPSSVISSKHTPPISPKTVSYSNSLSPTRRLAWDRQLLKSLEAQGFTPSPSKSKLAYDFRDRSPIKETSTGHSPIMDATRDIPPIQNIFKESPENQQPQKLENEPPKIVSIQSKSSINSPEKNRDSASETSKEEERYRSPSRVCNLRSQWEQHIRNASPEREIQRVSSPSPTRKFQRNIGRTSSCRSKSPIKDDHSCFKSSLKKSHLSRSISPSKSYQQLLLQDKQVPEASSSQKFTRGSGSRESLRSLSPHKPGPCGDVIKGETPMPETTLVVKNPAASVKERAAAFSSLAEQRVPVKDPAEMSVQDRLNIFEKKKGGALIPKGPFGHCISDKALHSATATRHHTTSSHTNASRSYEAPKAPKYTDINLSKTCVYPQSSSNVNTGHREGNLNPAASSVEAHKKRFEYLEDNWRETDINAKVMNERKSEMEQLLNRFRKPRGNSNTRKPIIVTKKVESDSDYPESENSNDEPEVFGSYHSDVALGPPKPPRTGAYEGSPSERGIPPPPPMPCSPRSPSKRLNSTELDESCPRSPSKEYIPKIKPGCVFPSLSDIESHSEAVESDDENKDSSFAESVLTSASIDSLGTHIQRMAEGASSGPTRQLSTIKEGLEARRTPEYQSMSTSTLDALEAIDDALEEAFDIDEEPTPPKRSRNVGEDERSNNVYKTPKICHDSTNSSNSSSSSENLAHSISMYRKQKPADIPVTPVRQLVMKPELCSPKDSPVSPSVTISSRIRELQGEEEHQLTVISQASSAISVVSQHLEQHGTMQHIEAEKVLLVATQKRQSALHEIQRLKAEGALGKRNYWTQDEDSCRGSISISNITLPLKQDFLDKSLNENTVHHFLVLVKHRDQVIISQLQTTPDCVVEGAITFPNLMALHNLTADFNISLEVYGFRVEPVNPSGFKKEHSRLKLTPLKRLHKESKTYSPAVSSPGGPYSIRNSSFTLIGFANLDINTLTRNARTLEKVPFNSPMNGHLLMRVAVTMEGSVSERSFLTTFDDVGGFGAWHRRWCVLSGPFIKYWSYPDDENRKECVGSLDLRMCTTRKVEQVSRDVCARRFTFQITFVRPLRIGDKTDLIHEIKHNALITRILLSADSKEERILWCNKLNKSLANVRAWDPDALKPEDFRV